MFNNTEKNNRPIFAVSSAESDDIRISNSGNGNCNSNNNSNNPRNVNSVNNNKINYPTEKMSIIAPGSYIQCDLSGFLILYYCLFYVMSSW